MKALNIKSIKEKMLKFIAAIFLFLFIFGSGKTFAQNTGDYRSVSTGNWTTLASWERFNGTTWATPTSGQGYPGQFAGTGAITIRTGHVITIGSTGITTQYIASLNIQSSGRLYLTGTNSTVTFSIQTSIVNIATGGDIYFFKKSKLVFIPNAAITLVIGQNGLVADVCNNNAELWVGTQKYAVCAGAPGDIFTFDQVILSGGTLNAIPTSNSPLCQTSTINLSGNYAGAIGTAPTYNWKVTPPSGSPATYTTQNVNISNASTGTYLAKLTVTTVLGGTTYTNSDSIYITVNPLPTLTGASQLKTVCDGSSATINLSGLVPSCTFDLYYKIGSGSTQTVTGLTSSAAGTSSYNTISLSAANNGQTLQITGIKITNPTTNCQQSFSQNVILSVWTTGAGTWIGTTNTDWNTASNWCGGVPTASTDVYIPAPSVSVPNQPTIGAAGGMCKNITIAESAVLTINNTNSLSVYGNWTNNGTFTPNSSTVNFNGSSAAQTIGGSGTNTFYNLKINNSYAGGGVKAGSDITVNNNINLASANPSATVGALEMVTNYSNYPGTTNANPGLNNMSSYYLNMGATATTTGIGDVTGIVKRTTINANTSYSFGNQYTTISLTPGTMPSAMTVTITIGTAVQSPGIKRTYEIVPNGGSGSHVSINFHYLDSELNGNSEAKLVTSDYDIDGGGNSTPDEHGRAAFDFTNNYIGLSNVPISYFIFVPVSQDWRTIFFLRDYQETYRVWNGSVNTNWYTENNWTPSGYPGIGDFVTIPAGAPRYPILTAGQNPSINTLTVESGASLDLGSNSNTFTINNSLSGGWEDQNGGVNPGNSTVVFANPGATISGLCNLYNVTIGSGATLSNAINTTLNIQNSVTNTGSWYCDVYSNTVNYSGAAQSVVLPDGDAKYYNLTFSGSGNKTLPASTMTISADFTLAGTASTTPSNALTVGGNFTIGNGTTFTAGNLTHTISGNIYNNGGTFTPSNSTILLNGLVQQMLSGTTSTTFNNLTVNNASGVTLGIGETVNGTLNLTNGLITTDSYTLTEGCSGSITNASATSYINGKLARIYCAIGSKEFPIGKGGNYRPFTLEYSSLTGTSTVTAEQLESGLPGTIPANTQIQTERYWVLSESGGSNYSFNLTLDGESFDPGSSGVPKIVTGNGSTNSLWNATFSVPNFTGTGFSSWGNFAVGSYCEPPTINSQPISASSCDLNGSPVFTVSASVASGTPAYQWEVSTTGTGGTFSNVTNTGVYSGATTSTLTITNPPYSMNGYAYRVVISRDCGSSTTSNGLAVLSVVQLPTITLTSDHLSACEGSATVNLDYNASSGSPDKYRIDYDASAEGAGFSDVALSNLPSSPISLNIPSTAGTYSGTLYVKNSVTTCESQGVPFTITINILPQGSLSGNTICATGGQGQLTWDVTSGTGPFTVVYNDGVADRTAYNVVSGTPFSVYSNPSVTTNYNLVSVSGQYCARTSGFSGDTATIIVMGGTNSIWLGTSDNEWSNASNWCGGVPNATRDAIIQHDTPFQPNITTNTGTAQCANLIIGENAVLTIMNGTAITTPALTVNGTTTNNGQIIIKASASGMGSFIDNGIAGNGIFDIQRYVSNNGGIRWEYVSSPISNASTTLFTTPAHGLWYCNETLNAWVNIPNTAPSTLNLLKGYTRKYVNGEGDGNTNITFSGSANTGTYSLAVTRTENAPGVKHGYNLMGNPYPSTIDWDAPLGWTKTNLTNVIYFRSNGNFGAYIPADTISQGPWSVGVGTNGASNYIPPMQAFWVRVRYDNGNSVNGLLACDNRVRVHNAHNIYKTSTPPNNIRITVTNNNNGLSDDTYLRFANYASDNFDETFDAPKMFAADSVYPQVYTSCVTDNLAINSCSELTGLKNISLGFNTSYSGQFTITADLVSSFTGAGNSVYLEDLLTGAYQNLSLNNTYQFYSSVASGLNRFVLHFNPVVTEVTDQSDENIVMYANESGVNFSSSQELFGQFEIFDILGNLVYSSSLTGVKSGTVTPNVTPAMYIVRYMDTKTTFTKKLFIH